ncbi:MAG: hypothetical protein WBP79_07710, partial [Candidatus Acidiferrales bacterium]
LVSRRRARAARANLPVLFVPQSCRAHSADPPYAQTGLSAPRGANPCSRGTIRDAKGRKIEIGKHHYFWLLEFGAGFVLNELQRFLIQNFGE